MSTTPTVSIAAIKEVLGSKFYMYRTTRRGVAVNLNLKELNTDGAKFFALLDAYNKLRDAGFPVAEENIQLTSKSNDEVPVWRSWLCVYVNRPEEAIPGAATAVVYTPEKILGLMAAGFSKDEVMEMIRTAGTGPATKMITADDVTEEVETSGDEPAESSDDSSNEEAEPVI